MIKSPRTQSEFEKALRMQECFPNLANGFSNGLSYRQIAQKVIDYDYLKDNPFRDLRPSTVTRYVAWALRGFEFDGNYYEGLREDKVQEEITRKRRKTAMQNSGLLPQFDVWEEQGDALIIKLYTQGLSPKEIFRRYNKVEEFNPRTFGAIESRICLLRKRGDIRGIQRIFWDGDLGFTALALLSMYKPEGNYMKHIRDELNRFYFQGEERITKSIFENFKKRNQETLEAILRENEEFERRSIL
ncbi:MAG: hypothetical protein ACMXYB_02340 [Candidatus Woesearchaeota archaeon]